jgi:hypothetical protein
MVDQAVASFVNKAKIEKRGQFGTLAKKKKPWGHGLSSRVVDSCACMMFFTIQKHACITCRFTDHPRQHRLISKVQKAIRPSLSFTLPPLCFFCPSLAGLSSFSFSFGWIHAIDVQDIMI